MKRICEPVDGTKERCVCVGGRKGAEKMGKGYDFVSLYGEWIAQRFQNCSKLGVPSKLRKSRSRTIFYRLRRFVPYDEISIYRIYPYRVDYHYAFDRPTITIRYDYAFTIPAPCYTVFEISRKSRPIEITGRHYRPPPVGFPVVFSPYSRFRFYTRVTFGLSNRVRTIDGLPFAIFIRKSVLLRLLT